LFLNQDRITKAEKMKKILLLLPIFLLMWACASSSTDKAVPDRTEAAPSPAPAKKTAAPETRPGKVEDRLNTAAFKDLPEEARSYLKLLAEAFRQKDLDFLVSQGEPQYETQNLPRYDIETYLAMLYRTGPYTQDSPVRQMALPRLEYKEITDIEFLTWAEQGPLIEIQARILPQKGEPIPCEIMLVWRLPAPKVLGIYP
jgi:hypothetical protein